MPRGWPEGLKAGPGPHDDEGEGHEAPDEEHHEHRAHRDRLGRGGRPPGEGGKDWKWGPWKGWWRWFRDCEFRWVWVWCIEGTCADPGGALSRGGRGAGEKDRSAWAERGSKAVHDCSLRRRRSESDSSGDRVWQGPGLMVYWAPCLEDAGL